MNRREVPPQHLHTGAIDIARTFSNRVSHVGRTSGAVRLQKLGIDQSVSHVSAIGVRYRFGRRGAAPCKCYNALQPGGNGSHETQAQTAAGRGSAIVRPIEALKHILALGDRNPGTVVLNPKHNHIFLRASTDLDATTARRMAARILGKVASI
jgi:hypothetical protein